MYWLQACAACSGNISSLKISDNVSTNENSEGNEENNLSDEKETSTTVRPHLIRKEVDSDDDDEDVVKESKDSDEPVIEEDQEEEDLCVIS